MKKLLFDCSCTETWASPSNWKTITSKSAQTTNWYVQCNFYDPRFKDKYPNGFPFRKKLNRIKNIEDRKAAIKLFLEEIPKLIFEKNYNPITKTFMVDPELEINNLFLTNIGPKTPFINALDLAHKSIKVADSTYNDIKYMLNKIKPAIINLKIDGLIISEVKRKDIRCIFDYLEETEDSFSEHKFNKYRGYLSTLFKELIEFEAVESDVVLQIKKRIHESKIRVTLSQDERKKVNKYLKEKFPDFWRFTNLFFHSGGRISELLNVKYEDINLQEQKYQVFIKKGKKYKWVERVIKDNALDFWIKSLYGAKKGDYIFSDGLVPGPKKIRREQITRRWKTHVKEKLNIKADFYALKHINLDETAALLSINDAAAMANHTSTAMVEKHYAIGEKERQFVRLKTINNNFA